MALTVLGIVENTCYLLNNPLVVDLTETNLSWFVCSISIEDVLTGKTYFIDRYFNNEGKLSLDLNEIIKPIFNEPELNLEGNQGYTNVMTFIIRFRPHNNISGPVFTPFKIGILRGGVYGNERNVVANTGLLLNKLEPLKYRSSFMNENTFPFFISILQKLSNNTFVINTIKNTLSTDNGTLMPIRNCGGTYLVFLNSKGGVSNWYFDAETENIKTTSLGYYSDYSKVIDYGAEYDREINFKSKSNIDMLDTIKDLFVSPYVVIYNVENDTYERVVISSQTLSIDKKNRTFYFDCKVQFITNVNTRSSW